MKAAILAACMIAIVSGSFLQIGNSSEKICELVIDESSEYAEEFYISGVPYKYQNENNWCGPASLAMVLSYWGEYVSQENIADSVINPDNLTKCENLAKYAKSLGFNAFYDSITIEELKENISMGYPIIVLQRFSLDYSWGHFRVVIGYDVETIINHDPLQGENYNLSYDDFVELWKIEKYENEFVAVYPSTPPIRDTTPPIISIISPGDGEILDNHWVKVYWDGSDQESGIERYEIKLDKSDWKDVKHAKFYLDSFSDGDHFVHVKAVNRAGKTAEDQVGFTVKTGGNGWLEYIQKNWFFIIIIVVIITVILIVAKYSNSL